MQVEVAAGTKLSEIAKMLKMKTSKLQSLNRQYKKGRVPTKKKQYQLVIPEDKMMLFYMKYEYKEEKKVTVKPHFISHYVVMGDTLESLAKDYNSSIDELMLANKLESEALTLDMLLLIPVTEHAFESYLNE
jgi:membrane-bound lytic murein transglycosylase D